MRVRNISKKEKWYVKIHRKHIGKTIVVYNLNDLCTASTVRFAWRKCDMFGVHIAFKSQPLSFFCIDYINVSKLILIILALPIQVYALDL